MNTSEITKRLISHLSKRPDFLVLTTNFAWELAFEADVMLITKEFEIFEFEIKYSRADFLRDKLKSKNGINKYDFLDGKQKLRDFFQEKRPNKFFYVCPSGLIKKNEIPQNYGLIEIYPAGQVCITKNAKRLHTNKTNNDFAFSIARNFCIKQCQYSRK